MFFQMRYGPRKGLLGKFLISDVTVKNGVRYKANRGTRDLRLNEDQCYMSE